MYSGLSLSACTSATREWCWRSMCLVCVAVRVLHDYGSLAVDINRQRVVLILVRAEVKWKGGVRRRVEGDSPLCISPNSPVRWCSHLMSLEASDPEMNSASEEESACVSCLELRHKACRRRRGRPSRSGSIWYLGKTLSLCRPTLRVVLGSWIVWWSRRHPGWDAGQGNGPGS